MKITVKLVRVGMNMSEATIVAWYKQPGESFVKGEAIYALETEKVTQDVEAIGNGTIVEILIPVDGTAEVGDPLFIAELDPTD